MSRLGTCAFAQQYALIERERTAPGERAYAEHWPEVYACNWLGFVENVWEQKLPPAIERMRGAFELKSGDCEGCPHYAPAGGNIVDILKLAKKRAKKSRRPKLRRGELT